MCARLVSVKKRPKTISRDALFQVRLTLPVAPKIQLNFGKVKIPESNLLFCSWFKKADCYLGLRYFILCMNK